MSENGIDYKELFSEFIGTFGLVLIGGWAMLNADYGSFDLVGVSLTLFLVLSFMVYFGRQFSEAHFNPAVTLSFVATRKMPIRLGVYYIISQLLGSVFAGIFLKIFTPTAILNKAISKSKLGFPHLTKITTPVQGMFIEMIITFFFVFVFWAMVIDRKAPSQIFGLAIGGTLGFDILAAGSFTGAATNPARVFGPALIALDFNNQWVYWIGPILGALIAGFLYYYVFLDKEK